MTKYKNGNDFLNKIYKDLNLSEEVMHVSNISDNQVERIGKFINRLDRVHNMANTKERKDRIKKLYHDKYVIKRENLSGLSLEKQNEIIDAQTNKLDAWIDYLTDEDARYPMWAKYWAFQGMLKIGKYDEANDTYGKRNYKTRSPFIEVNPEVLSKCIEMVINTVEGKEIDDKNLEKLVDSGNFQKLYTILLKENKKNKLESSGFEGKWIKYGIGSKEEAKKLYDSLQGYNTGWCTAGSLSTAESQVCGGGGYAGGDFYAYYTKDTNNEYKIPRIAIRMDGRRKIGEIRGVDESQNLEEGFEDIVEEKLNEMIFLSDEDKSEAMKKINNSRELTKLNRKATEKKELTKEEQLFIFATDIVTFGWEEDPRIRKIIEKTKLTYRDVALKAVKQHGYALGYASEDLKNDKELIILALEDIGIKQIKLEKNVKEIMLDAIKQKVTVMKVTSEKLKSDNEFILEAVKQNRLALQYASEDLKNNKEVVLEAIKLDGDTLQYASEDLKKDKKFMIEAVKQNGDTLQYASEELKKDKEVVLEAVKQNGNALYYASEELKKDKEVVLAAVKKYGCALEHASENLKNDKEVVLEAVKQNGFALIFASKELKNDIEFITNLARLNPAILNYFSGEKKVKLTETLNKESIDDYGHNM